MNSGRDNKNSKKDKTSWVILCTVLLFYSLISSYTFGQNYNIPIYVLDSGGQEGSSADYMLVDAIGQSMIGDIASSASFNEYVGFWYAIPETTEGWTITLTIIGQCDANSYERARYFGVHINGTDGFDPELDVSLPPPPPIPQFEAYFEIPGWRLSTDIRSSEDSLVEWTLKINNATGCVDTINWDSEDLPQEGCFTLDGIDMRTRSLAVFEGDTTLYIRYCYSHTCTLDIPMTSVCGWNMASIPVIPENRHVNSVFPGNCGVFTWNGVIYDMSDTVECGVGYWVCYVEPCTVRVIGECCTEYTRYLEEGWNMIGSTTDDVDFTDPNDNPDGSIIPGSLFGFDPTTCSYVPATIIEPTKAYWVAVFQPCQLTVSNTTKGKRETASVTGGTSQSSLATKSFVSSKKLNTFYAKYGALPPLPPSNLPKVSTLPIPQAYELTQNYPNPFSSVTSIQYSVVREEAVLLSIYDISGRLVRTLVNETKAAGHYTANWDGRNESGKKVTSGIYFYKLQVHADLETHAGLGIGSYTEIRKMILVR